MAYLHKNICAVTAAMKYGTGLQYFNKALPERFFDVGIAEQHAVTFCAGLASNGMIPVFAVYSTFLQRSYDQLIHDLAIMKTHAVIGVDRAGIVGEDGETHQGIFDVPFLTTVPGITIYSPSNYSELEACLEKAVLSDEGVCAVRYPRGADKSTERIANPPTDYKYQNNRSRILAVTYGRLYGNLLEAHDIVCRGGHDFDILKLVKIFPLSDEISEIIRSYDKVIFFEECYRYGSIGEKYAAMCGNCELSAIDGFVPHGSPDSLLERLGLSARRMADKINGCFGDET
jgi:1-deoxy-D-xylulose-5-phosphate synthase